jgi:hypothetical protein
MVSALKTLGVELEEDWENLRMTVHGCGGHFPVEGADLFLGNAGTAMRPLTAAVAAAGRGTFVLDGIARMRERPIQVSPHPSHPCTATYHPRRRFPWYYFSLTTACEERWGGCVRSSRGMSFYITVLFDCERTLWTGWCSSGWMRAAHSARAARPSRLKRRVYPLAPSV